jgi:hypothetical protein
MVTSAPTRDIGYLDQVYGYWLGDLLEQIPDLIWPNSVQTYARMRTDPQLTAVLAAYTLPIRRAAWSVDPAGCRDEVVQLVADDLGLPILGADDRPGPARRRGVRWADHLRLALNSLTYGFMPFERRYEIVDGQARLVNLGERMPHTIGAINLNRDGTIATVQQDVGTTQKIPADRLVWYVHEREGSNWTGRSILRPAYGAWLLKHEVWRVHATSIRRFGMGVPSVEAPTGATPGQVLEAQRLASALRVGDQSGVGLPPGFKLSLTGMTGSVPDAMAFVSYLDQQMAKQALAGLLDLGQTPNGSRALGDSLKDMFLLSLQAVAEEIAETATSGQPGMDGIVTQLVNYNWGDSEPAPRIVVADVGSRQEITAEALDILIRAGAITPDAALEEFVRNTWKLPQKAENAPQPAPASAPPVQARTRRRSRQKRAQAAQEGGQRRQLTLLEAQAGIDPDAIHAVWQNALDRLLDDWQEISADWRAALAERVAALVNAGDLTALASIVLDATAAAVLLADAMVEVAREAIRQLVVEAASQGVTVDPPEPDEVGLTAIARAIAALLAGWLSGAAGREALRIAVPGADGEQVADGVTAHLESLSDAFLRDQLGAALSQAQASGRFAVLDEAPEAQYLASEVLDSGTCPSCLEIDGTTFDSLDDAKAAYANGGYIGCEGRLRCRGIIAALWPEGA